MGGPFASFEGGSSHPVTPGAIYRGTVKKIRDDGKLSVAVPRLGNQVIHNCNALRGPENNPYLVDDQVLCVYLNNEQSELYVLGRFNYKIDVNNPEFNLENITLWNQTTRQASTYRHTGINIHDPQFPLHVGGQTRQRSTTIKVEPTEYPNSYRAGIDLDRTGLMSGGNDYARGDFGIYDGNTSGWLMYHTGYWGTDGGHAGNYADAYLYIGGASGGDGRTTPAGDQERKIYIYPSVGGNTTEYCALSWSGAGLGGYAYVALGSVEYHNGSLRPATWNGSWDLGSTSYRWQDIYLTNQPNVSSDENLKTDIVDSDLGLDFINGLRPVSFKWIARDDGGPGVRRHYGLIAQEVQTLLGDSAADTAIWTEEEIPASDEQAEKCDQDGLVTIPARPAVEEHTLQGLRYDELVAPIIKAIQEVDDRVEGLGAANVEEALTLAQAAIDYCQSFDAAYLAKQPHFEEREALLDDIVARVEALEG